MPAGPRYVPDEFHIWQFKPVLNAADEYRRVCRHLGNVAVDPVDFHPVISQYPFQPARPFFIGGEEHHPVFRFQPAVPLRFKSVHLPVELLHGPSDEVDDILRLGVRHLPHEHRQVHFLL